MWPDWLVRAATNVWRLHQVGLLCILGAAAYAAVVVLVGALVGYPAMDPPLSEAWHLAVLSVSPVTPLAGSLIWKPLREPLIAWLRSLCSGPRFASASLSLVAVIGNSSVGTGLLLSESNAEALIHATSDAHRWKLATLGRQLDDFSNTESGRFGNREFLDSYVWTLAARQATAPVDEHVERILRNQTGWASNLLLRTYAHMGLANMAKTRGNGLEAKRHLDLAHQLAARWLSRDVYGNVIGNEAFLALMMSAQASGGAERDAWIARAEALYDELGDDPDSRLAGSPHGLDNNRGSVYALKGRWELANRYWTRTIEAFPDWEHVPDLQRPILADAYNNRGVWQLASQSWDYAVEDLSRADRLIEGDNRRTKLNLIIAYIKRGDPEQARRAVVLLEPTTERAADWALFRLAHRGSDLGRNYYGRALGAPLQEGISLGPVERRALARLLNEEYLGLSFSEDEF